MSLSKDGRENQIKMQPKNSLVPPRNPNKRPTIINMKRSIGEMKAHDRDIIRQLRGRLY